MAKPLVRIADNVAPTHHKVIRCDGQQLHPCAAENASYKLPGTFEGWAFDETDVPPLPCHRVHDCIEAFRVPLSSRDNANFVHVSPQTNAQLFSKKQKRRGKSVRQSTLFRIDFSRSAVISFAASGFSVPLASASGMVRRLRMR